jgi:hypothetical protein
VAAWIFAVCSILPIGRVMPFNHIVVPLVGLVGVISGIIPAASVNRRARVHGRIIPAIYAGILVWSIVMAIIGT